LLNKIYLKGWVFLLKLAYKILQFITFTSSRSKTFPKDAERRCVKKLIPKNKRNLQYCVTKLIQIKLEVWIRISENYETQSLKGLDTPHVDFIHGDR